jgi:hypothetical protein
MQNSLIIVFRRRPILIRLDRSDVMGLTPDLSAFPYLVPSGLPHEIRNEIIGRRPNLVTSSRWSLFTIRIRTVWEQSL